MLEPCPHLVKSVKLTAKHLALSSQHTDALSLLEQIEDTEVCKFKL